MNLERAIDRAFERNNFKKYPKFYIAVDLHDTIIPSNYKNGEFERPYDGAIKTLSFLSKLEDVCLILFTSSYLENVPSIYEELSKYEIKFEYFNENPECANTETGDFSTKFFYNLILDDKAGFDPLEDWEIVFSKFKTEYSKKKKKQLVDSTLRFN